MSLLENGVHVWRVEALSLSADGKVERRGKAGEFRFTLSIPQPGRPVPNSPDILYRVEPP
jgi:hypothetical protein